jgi:hypothetical protein
MSTKIEEFPQIINWKINLKNGTSLDINVRDGDEHDQALKKWVANMSNGFHEYFIGSFEHGEIWVAPGEFCMALRSPHRAKSTEQESSQEAV